MNEKCWKEELSQTYKRLYYIDLETGKSRWSKPSTKLLPLGWEMHISRKLDTAYYGFSETGVTQWDEPTGPIEKPKSPPAGWKILNSPCNNIYYQNIISGITQWEYPKSVNFNADNIQFHWPCELSNWEGEWVLKTKDKPIKKLGSYTFNPSTLAITSKFLGKDDKVSHVMLSKCKAPASAFVLNKSEKLPDEIKIVISNIQDEIQTPSLSGGRQRVFVIPSQLNAAEYPFPDVIIKKLQRYITNNRVGSRGQLGADPAIAQFIIDNASNIEDEKRGINNIRLMGTIPGITLKNGYLQVKDDADISLFAKRLPDMSILGVRDVPVRGLDKTLDEFIDTTHTVDLIYASAVPILGEYNFGNSDHSTVKTIADLTLFAQYVGSMRLAIFRGKCDLFLMLLGVKTFSNDILNIRSAIINAYKFMEKDLKKADIKVYVLISEKEKDAFNS